MSQNATHTEMLHFKVLLTIAPKGKPPLYYRCVYTSNRRQDLQSLTHHPHHSTLPFLVHTFPHPLSPLQSLTHHPHHSTLPFLVHTFPHPLSPLQSMTHHPHHSTLPFLVHTFLRPFSPPHIPEEGWAGVPSGTQSVHSRLIRAVVSSGTTCISALPYSLVARRACKREGNMRVRRGT